MAVKIYLWGVEDLFGADTNRKETIMKKTALILLLAGFFMCGHCQAEAFEGKVMVSGHSIRADIHTVQRMADGYWKTGVSGVYTEDDDTEYKWGELLFMVGSDVLKPGLTCEVGLKGILGKAEEGIYSGDVGTVAFSGLASYDFAQQMALPGSFEVYMGFDYANEILSFMDTDDYLAFHFGVDIPLFERASVIMEYSTFDMDMKDNPGPWSLDDDRFRIGLSLNF
jgi:hypothetical protein